MCCGLLIPVVPENPIRPDSRIEIESAHHPGRPAARRAKFDRGDAMALPFPGDAFDAAIMAVVIFFD
jgi:ubiquinone/menaquinone biosynthesis C-methylase UbiE